MSHPEVMFILGFICFPLLIFAVYMVVKIYIIARYEEFEVGDLVYVDGELCSVSHVYQSWPKTIYDVNPIPEHINDPAPPILEVHVSDMTLYRRGDARKRNNKE